MLRNHLKEVFTNLSFGVQMFQHLSAGSCELNCYPGQICVCRPPLPFVDPIICSPQPPSTWTRHVVPFELWYSESGIKLQEYATQFLHCCTSSCWITLLSWPVSQWISHSFQIAYFHLPNSTFSKSSHTLTFKVHALNCNISQAASCSMISNQHSTCPVPILDFRNQLS